METIRTRGWRHAQKRRNKSRDVHTGILTFRGEKNWKMLYTRSDKLLRAAQLGLEYPRVTHQQLASRGLEEYQRSDECTFLYAVVINGEAPRRNRCSAVIPHLSCAPQARVGMRKPAFQLTCFNGPTLSA